MTRITTVEVSGNTIPVVYGLQAYTQRPYFTLSEDQVAEDLKGQNIWWENIYVQKIFPNKLAIAVSMEKPVAYFREGNVYILLSKKGRILQKEHNPSRSLPILNYYQNIPLSELMTGKTIDLKDITKTLVFIEESRRIGLVADSVDIDSRDMVALQIESKRIEFSTQKPIDVQIYQLERIIKQLKIEGKSYLRVDLRFDRPVIEFEQ